MKRTISSSESEQDTHTKKTKTGDDNDETRIESDGEAGEKGKEQEQPNKDQNTNTNDEKLSGLNEKEESDDAETQAENDEGSQQEEMEMEPQIRQEQHEPIIEETDEERTVYIKCLTTDITKTNPMRMTQQIEEITGKLKSIQKSKDSLKVICKTIHDKMKLLKVKSLQGHTAVITEPFSLKRKAAQASHLNRGIIFGVPKDITNDEMSTSIGRKAERILKKRGPNQIITEQMIIYCEYELPRFVYDGWNRYRVSVYIPEPYTLLSLPTVRAQGPNMQIKKRHMPHLLWHTRLQSMPHQRHSPRN